VNTFREDKRADSSDTVAFVWVVVAALGVLGLATGIVFAPTLGELLQSERLDIWPDERVESLFQPESTELARYAIAVITPLAAALVLVFARTWPTQLSNSRFVSALPVLGTMGIFSVVAVGWLSRSEPMSFGVDPNYFGERHLAMAFLVAAGVLFVALRPRDASAISRAREALTRPDPLAPVSVPVALAAIGATVLFVLPAVYTDASLADAAPVTLGHLHFTFADYTAFGNGLTPLADFAGEYSNLLPWLGHPPLSAFDYSPGAFTALMAVLSVLCLLALWRALALTAQNELAGFLLYLPVLAISLRPTIEVGDERDSNASLVQILPERYLFPCLLAWVVSRHLRGLRPHTPLTLFIAASFALLNNPEFGGPCLVAVFIALLIGAPRVDSRATILRLAGQLAAGLGAAVSIVALVTLIRSGTLPQPELFTYYSRLFGSQGFGLLPMPTLGFHLVVYVSLVGALLLGASRHRAGASDRALSGLLAYAGCFGLLAGIYYVGRSSSPMMVALFPAWGFSLALVAWAGIRWISRAGGGWRRALTPAVALAALALLGLGLAATALLKMPAPWSQAARLADDSDQISAFDLLPEAERFVASQTQEGEPVLILRENGHLLARNASVQNVSFLGDPVFVVSPSQLDDLLGDLREAGGSTVFVGDGIFIRINPGVRPELRARGYRPTEVDRASGMVVWRPQR
jgi:hypothetical protein